MAPMQFFIAFVLQQCEELGKDAVLFDQIILQQLIWNVSASNLYVIIEWLNIHHKLAYIYIVLSYAC